LRGEQAVSKLCDLRACNNIEMVFPGSYSAAARQVADGGGKTVKFDLTVTFLDPDAV